MLPQHATPPVDWMVSGDPVEFSVNWGGVAGVRIMPSALEISLKKGNETGHLHGIFEFTEDMITLIVFGP